MESVDIVLRDKLAELELLQNELHLATQDFGDMDYEFASILTEAIRKLQVEIQYLFHLQCLPEPISADGFINYLHQFLAGDWQILNISVDIRGYAEYSGPVVQIKKMKTQHRVQCVISLNSKLSFHVDPDLRIELVRLGWTSSHRNTEFIYRARLRNADDLKSFHVWLSRTLLGPFKSFWSNAYKQYYFLTK